MTINMYIATVAWICLMLGFVNRSNRKRHIRLMLVGIFLDIGLVLFLQVTRHAVQTAMELKLEVLPQLHILFSTLALVCYFPVLWFGFQLAFGEPLRSTKTWHLRFAYPAIFFRTIGFGLMFSMIGAAR